MIRGCVMRRYVMTRSLSYAVCIHLISPSPSRDPNALPPSSPSFLHYSLDLHAPTPPPDSSTPSCLGLARSLVRTRLDFLRVPHGALLAVWLALVLVRWLGLVRWRWRWPNDVESLQRHVRGEQCGHWGEK